MHLWKYEILIAVHYFPIPEYTRTYAEHLHLYVIYTYVCRKLEGIVFSAVVKHCHQILCLTLGVANVIPRELSDVIGRHPCVMHLNYLINDTTCDLL